MRGHTLAVGSSDTFPVGCGMVPLCLHTTLLGRLACIDYPLQWVVKLQATCTGEQLNEEHPCRQIEEDFFSLPVLFSGQENGTLNGTQLNVSCQPGGEGH